MDGDMLARIGYLGLLFIAIGGWLVVENRHRLGAMMRQALAWGLIFLGVIAAYGLWSDIRTDVAPRQSVATDGARITLPRAPDGHFYLTLYVGEVPIRFMVDTGASSIVLSNRAAEQLGINPRSLAYIGQARTANGTIRTARVTLKDVRLGATSEGNLPAWVGDGVLEMSLLGMDYLRRFSKVELTGERLVLIR